MDDIDIDIRHSVIKEREGETCMQFINPYNFIAIEGKNPERVDKLEEGLNKGQSDLKTGVITYKLTTKTPLFIPNTSSDRAFPYVNEAQEKDDPDKEHKFQDFFSYTDLSHTNKPYTEENAERLDFKKDVYEPVIPGSEVRGMIRSVYETLTNSCFSVMDEENVISKRTKEYFKPGLLERQEDGSYRLYYVDDYLYRDSTDFAIKFNNNQNWPQEIRGLKDCSEVFFKADDRTAVITGRDGQEKTVSIKPIVTKISIDKTENAMKKGYLIKGEAGPEISPKEGDSRCCAKYCANYRKKDDEKHRCEGYVAEGNPEKCYLAEKHCAHVFKKKKLVKVGEEELQISQDEVNELGKVIEAYQKKEEGRYAEYQRAYNQFLNQERNIIPVYYSLLEFTDSNLLRRTMLSPACITREVYRNMPATALQEYKKCGHKENKGKGVCPACRLFGMIGASEFFDSKTPVKALGSKIRFADLRIREKKNYGKDEIPYKEYYEANLETLEELASPHPSNSEFYLKKPDENAIFWTYDYYIVDNGKGPIVKEYEADPTQIRGRKFYWNKKSYEVRGEQKLKIERNEQEIENPQYVHRTNRNKTVRLLKKDVSFEGKLYFENITKTQLEQLLYILKFTSDGKHGFKLGSGKPLGLGSVQLEVTGTEVRTYDASKKAYSCNSFIATETEYENLGFIEGVKKSFEIITKYLEQEDGLIHYPCVTGEIGEEGFKWFQSNNNFNSAKTREGMRIYSTLPDLKEDTDFKMGKADVQVTNTMLDLFIRGKIYQAVVWKESIYREKGKFWSCKINIEGCANNRELQISAKGKEKREKGQKIKVKYIGNKNGRHNFEEI